VPIGMSASPLRNRPSSPPSSRPRDTSVSAQESSRGNTVELALRRFGFRFPVANKRPSCETPGEPESGDRSSGARLPRLDVQRERDVAVADTREPGHRRGTGRGANVRGSSEQQDLLAAFEANWRSPLATGR
jgi:hypothetical protein